MILVVAPWSAFWDRNFFVAAFPAFDTLLSSPYARGAVSGVGLITGLAGLVELAGAFASRRDASDFERPTIPSNQ